MRPKGPINEAEGRQRVRFSRGAAITPPHQLGVWGALWAPCRGIRRFVPKFCTIFCSQNGLSWHYDIDCRSQKISPVEDWRSTSLEWPWPWPWIRPYGIPSCISHRPLPTYQVSLKSEENFFRKSPVRFCPSSKSRDTKTRTNIRNPARANLDIVL